MGLNRIGGAVASSAPGIRCDFANRPDPADCAPGTLMTCPDLRNAVFVAAADDGFAEWKPYLGRQTFARWRGALRIDASDPQNVAKLLLSDPALVVPGGLLGISNELGVKLLFTELYTSAAAVYTIMYSARLRLEGKLGGSDASAYLNQGSSGSAMYLNNTLSQETNKKAASRVVVARATGWSSAIVGDVLNAYYPDGSLSHLSYIDSGVDMRVEIWSNTSSPLVAGILSGVDLEIGA